MPKRTTLTFTSEDAPLDAPQDRLLVYYCKYTGKHAFTIDRDISTLPRRRTDGSRIVDTEEQFLKLNTTPGETKVIKRHNGNIERQYRVNVGQLPVAYRSEPEGRYVYIIPDAVVTYVNQAVITGNKILVPWCIKKLSQGGCEIKLEIEDRVHRPALVKVNPDHVRIHITTSAAGDGAQEEIIQMMGKALGVRLTQLHLHKGHRPRSKFLVVDNMTPEEVFQKLQASVGRIQTAPEPNKARPGGAR